MSNTHGTSIIIVRLLGGAELAGVDRDKSDQLLAQPKAVATLALLAISGAGDAWVRRDRIAALLWPELDQAHARAALRKIVLALRSGLGQDVLMARGDEDLRFNDELVTSDVAGFGRYLECGMYDRALELYRGELLPGFHVPGCAELDRWLDSERAELRERASATAWALAQRLEGDQNTAAGMWARRAVRYSWDDERVLRRTLALLDRVGDRAGALRLYDEFSKRLKADFDAEPSPETVKLASQLRR